VHRRGASLAEDQQAAAREDRNHLRRARHRTLRHRFRLDGDPHHLLPSPCADRLGRPRGLLVFAVKLIAACVLSLVLLTAAAYMDLPVSPVKFGDPPRVVTPTPPPAPPAGVSLPGVNPLDIPAPPLRPHAPPPEPTPRDVPAPVFYGEDIQTEGSSLVYVLDRSGSMFSDFMPLAEPWRGWVWAGSRWHRAMAELKTSISGLAENFRFNVVLYDHMLKQWSTELRPATDANKAAAIYWADHEPPNGGATATGPATCQGLSLGAGCVVLLTDGAPNAGAPSPAAHREMIARNSASRRRAPPAHSAKALQVTRAARFTTCAESLLFI